MHSQKALHTGGVREHGWRIVADVRVVIDHLREFGDEVVDEVEEARATVAALRVRRAVACVVAEVGKPAREDDAPAEPVCRNGCRTLRDECGVVGHVHRVVRKPVPPVVVRRAILRRVRAGGVEPAERVRVADPVGDRNCESIGNCFEE
jgi:hypothetical protein